MKGKFEICKELLAKISAREKDIPNKLKTVVGSPEISKEYRQKTGSITKPKNLNGPNKLNFNGIDLQTPNCKLKNHEKAKNYSF